MKRCLPLLVLLCSCATAADRVAQDVAFLAAPGLEGRGLGTRGLETAGAYIEARFEGYRLKPAGDSGTFRQAFPVTTAVKPELEQRQAYNVVGMIEAGEGKLPEAIVIGAHYDHLGYGGRYSLAPDKREPHLGADDNASGVAALLEIARYLSEHREELRRDVILIAFSAGEHGLLGSRHFTRQRGDAGMKQLAAMLNLDMVGRLRSNRLLVLGSESAEGWGLLITAACDQAHLECASSGNSYGPSDHSPFYAAGVPVLHFFTGAHEDYHKPSDKADGVNAAGTARISELVSRIALRLGERDVLTYRSERAQ